MMRIVVNTAIVILFVSEILMTNNLIERENVLDRISQWPYLDVKMLDGVVISIGRLPSELPLLMNYSNSEYIFSRVKFRDIFTDSRLPDKALMLFVSDVALEAIQQFRTEMRLDREPRLIQFYRGRVEIDVFWSQLKKQ